MKQLTAVILASIMAGVSAKASVTINFDVGEITSGGSLVNGTFLFVSHGTDNTFNSTSWTSGSSFLLGDDSLIGAFSIVNGSATSAIAGYVSPTGYGSTKFTGVFISGLGSSDINYSTGSLLNSKTFTSSGGTSYNFGSYRTDVVEGFGFGPDGNMAWTLPADGNTLSLFAASNTDIGESGLYLGADVSANLATSSTFQIVPEPSTGALLMIGSVGLVALRRLRKV